MLPRGMVGQKCHPPLSTIPEVWRCAAGRQASRSARRGWREIRGNSINGRFLRTRERAQLHTHLNAGCAHLVTNVTHSWMHTRAPQSISYTSPTVRGYWRDRRTRGTHVLYNSFVSFFSSLHCFSLFILLLLNFLSSPLFQQRVGSVVSPPLSVSLSLRW